MLSKESQNSYSIKVVENALAVLEAFGEVEGEIRITHLSEVLGMEKSYVFRLLSTFEQCGYIEQSEKSGKYRLGLSAYKMGQKFLLRMDLLTNAKPAMERLARQCNEAVYLAVPREHELFMIDMVGSTQVVSTIPLVGNIYPLFQTAAGKAILEREVRLDSGGFGEGTASIAAPLFDGQEKVPASLCIVGPGFRLTDTRMVGEVLPRLQEACEEVSAKLGYLDRHLPRIDFPEMSIHS